jgi:branched-chain amino acid transport system permease protein
MASAIVMYALTRTPFGRICNAVRDNPERVEFIGYNPHVVRFLAYGFAGFFAGLAGSLAAINFEIANSAYLGASQSGYVLFAAFTGGTAQFAGPILGAALVTFLQLELSDVTAVWQLYFGIVFIGIVIFAPGGVAGLIVMHRPLLRAGALTMVIPSYLAAAVPTLALALGVILSIETAARYTANQDQSNVINLLGVAFDATRPWTWAVAAILVVAGFLVARLSWRRVAEAWDRASAVARSREQLA